MKKNAAFSLIELLVVVAIIGILAGLMAAGFGNMRASAQEQQCRNNLKQLHDAVLSYAMTHNKEPPRAQAYDCIVYGTINAATAWVSLVPSDKKAETYRKFLKLAGKESPLANFSDDLGCGWAAKFGIENGDLFQYVGDLAPYACPTMVAHVRKRADLVENDGEEVLPYRTYAMNAYFGCADSEFNLARPTCDHLYLDMLGRADGKGLTKYRLKKGSTLGHIPEPSRLLLFSEIVPSYKNDDMVARKTSGTSESFTVQTVRGGPSSSDCCLNAASIDQADERIGTDVNWDKHWDETKKLRAGYSASQYGYKFGVHPTGLKRSFKKRGTVEIMGSLAVFMDGHIEKVFANTDGEEDGANTTWFYTRGYDPSNAMPKGY